MRAISLKYVPTAVLSRQTAGIRGKSLVINLPGMVSSCMAGRDQGEVPRDQLTRDGIIMHGREGLLGSCPMIPVPV